MQKNMPKIICYEKKEVEKVFRDIRWFCASSNNTCVKISAVGNDFLHVPIGTFHVLVTDIEDISVRKMIETINYLLNFGCCVYVDTINPAIVDILNRQCDKCYNFVQMKH